MGPWKDARCNNRSVPKMNGIEGESAPMLYGVWNSGYEHSTLLGVYGSEEEADRVSAMLEEWWDVLLGQTVCRRMALVFEPEDWSHREQIESPFDREDRVEEQETVWIPYPLGRDDWHASTISSHDTYGYGPMDFLGKLDNEGRLKPQ